MAKLSLKQLLNHIYILGVPAEKAGVLLTAIRHCERSAAICWAYCFTSSQRRNFHYKQGSLNSYKK